LVLVDDQGQVVVQASRLSQTVSNEVTNRLVATEALAQTKQGERYISSVYIDDLTFEPLVIMAVPVENVFGDYQGTLIAETNLKFMWDLVDSLEVGQEGTAYVVDRQGNLLAFGDVTRVIAGENLSHLEEVAEFVEGEDLSSEDDSVQVYTGINNTNVLAAYEPLGTPDWAVVTELPVAEAYRGVIENVIIFMAIIVVAIVLAGGAGAYIARRLAAPVQHLTDTATHIAEGDLQLQAPQAEGPTEVRQLAGAFNRMTGQLNELINSLEGRVATRTQRLELVASLSGQLVAILDVDQLLTKLVNQVKDRFSYYHAHVYIINRESESLVMRAGAGTAGEAMKTQGHSIPLNAATSLVARAARTGRVVSIDNVREALDWLPNPLLPDTYSEMAVPIILEEQVVGVLDVQQDEIAGLDESDANVLRSLANIVSVAIRNARLFREVESALVETRAAQKRYVAESWDISGSDTQTRERIYMQPGMVELSDATFNAARSQALAQEHPAIVPIDDYEGSPKPLVAPLLVSGQPIGALQLHKMDAEDTSQLWTEQDLEFVEAILDQVAQSAENLRLFEETRERARREQATREIAEKMQAATDLEGLIKIAADELGQYFSLEYATVELGIDKVTE
jgi:GAF domain-containing protein